MKSKKLEKTKFCTDKFSFLGRIIYPKCIKPYFSKSNMTRNYFIQKKKTITKNPRFSKMVTKIYSKLILTHSSLQ